ncbi:MAG: amidohydrolase family protein, partial [Desulfobulbaceae bacterium]|nr:amidohydrolase family protein [Desulfobulbaceae bacterium]
STGARVLRLGEQIGSLTVGRKADCIMLDLNQANLTPFYGPTLLPTAASGHDVRTTIINGRLVMHDRRMLYFDEAETMAKVRELAGKVRIPT